MAYVPPSMRKGHTPSTGQNIPDFSIDFLDFEKKQLNNNKLSNNLVCLMNTTSDIDLLMRIINNKEISKKKGAGYAGFYTTPIFSFNSIQCINKLTKHGNFIIIFNKSLIYKQQNIGFKKEVGGGFMDKTEKKFTNVNKYTDLGKEIRNKFNNDPDSITKSSSDKDDSYYYFAGEIVFNVRDRDDNEPSITRDLVKYIKKIIFIESKTSKSQLLRMCENKLGRNIIKKSTFLTYEQSKQKKINFKQIVKRRTKRCRKGFKLNKKTRKCKKKTKRKRY